VHTLTLTTLSHSPHCVCSYKDGCVIHLVQSKKVAQSPAAQAPAPQQAQTRPGGGGGLGMGAGGMQGMQDEMMRNPQMMEQMMNNPMMVRCGAVLLSLLCSRARPAHPSAHHAAFPPLTFATDPFPLTGEPDGKPRDYATGADGSTLVNLHTHASITFPFTTPTHIPPSGGAL
jgi:hypothetical protein